MTPHIQQTIADIDTIIQRLQAAREAIICIDPFPTPGVDVVSVPIPVRDSAAHSGPFHEINGCAVPIQSANPTNGSAKPIRPRRTPAAKPKARAARSTATDRARPEKLTVPAAFQIIISQWAGEFNSAMIRDAAIRQFPSIKRKIETATAVTLNALVKRGELTKTGHGQTSKFKRVGAGVTDLTALQRQIHAEIDAAKPQDD